MNKCKFCGSNGIIREIGGLFYAQCSGCNKHIKNLNDEYQYMGSTRANCINVWNLNNSETKKNAPSTRPYHSNIM